MSTAGLHALGKRILVWAFVMLRPSPTIISLSKRDVTEHLGDISRKAATSQHSGVPQPPNTKLVLQPFYGRQLTFTDATTATFRSPCAPQATRHCPMGEAATDESNGPDGTFEPGLSDGSGVYEGQHTEPYDRLSSSPQLPPTSQLLSSADTDVLETDDEYQANGRSLAGTYDNADECIHLMERVSPRHSESRRQVIPYEINSDGGSVVKRPSQDSPSFGKSKSLLIKWHVSLI